MGHEKTSQIRLSTDTSEQFLVDIWREIVLQTCERFDLNSTMLIEGEIVASGRSFSWPHSFSQQVSIDGKLAIPNITETPAPLLRALLSREALRCLLAHENLDERPLFDIACEYGLQTLNLKNAELWEKEWIKQSPEITLPNGIVYQPHSMFRALRLLSDKEGLDLLVRRLSSLVRLGVKVQFEEWAGYLFRFIREYNHPLTDLEARILHHLLNNPDITRIELSSKIKVSPDWTGKVITGIKDRGQLREFEYLSFPALGIRAFQIVLLRNRESLLEPHALIAKCPFLYSMHRIPFDRGGLFATLCIPDNPMNLKYVDRMIRIAANNGIDTVVYEKVKSQPLYNIYCYNSQDHRWDIDWSAVQLEAEVVDSTGVAPLYPGVPPDPPERVSECDGLDAQILVEFQKGRTTIADLREVIKRRTSDVAKRLNRFRELGVIKHFWELHYTGLNNDMILVCPSIEASQVVTSIAARLPKCFIDFNESGLVLLRAQLPEGGAVRLAKALGSLDASPYVYILDTRIYGQWNLERFIHDWSSYTGAWDACGESIDNWLDAIERV